MKILKNEELDTRLEEYYKKHYGEMDSDIWYEQPAANVWVFKRNNKIITLKSHILTGDVTEMVEELEN